MRLSEIVSIRLRLRHLMYQTLAIDFAHGRRHAKLRIRLYVPDTQADAANGAIGDPHAGPR
jgi:hypothetical protein